MTTGRRSLIAVALTAMCCTVAACASASSGARPPSPATAAAPATSATSGPGSDPLSLDNCASIRPVRVLAAGDEQIAVLGTGSRVVILTDESDEDLCTWLPFATTLTDAGYRVALWDIAGVDPVAELIRVTVAVRGAGTRSIVLMGASQGAKASLIAAVSIRPAVAGVVSLSAESTLRATIDVPRAVRPLRVPVLLVTASHDAYGSDTAGPDIKKSMAGTDKRLIVVAGTDHGTALLSGRAGPAVTADVMAFLHRVLR